MNARMEIAALRAEEREVEAGTREFDRLARSLVPLWERTIVVAGWLPEGAWCELPVGWQVMRELKVTLRKGVPPASGGAIAVGVGLARQMVGWHERRA